MVDLLISLVVDVVRAFFLTLAHGLAVVFCFALTWLFLLAAGKSQYSDPGSNGTGFPPKVRVQKKNDPHG